MEMIIMLQQTTTAVIAAIQCVAIGLNTRVATIPILVTITGVGRAVVAILAIVAAVARVHCQTQNRLRPMMTKRSQSQVGTVHKSQIKLKMPIADPSAVPVRFPVQKLRICTINGWRFTSLSACRLQCHLLCNMQCHLQCLPRCLLLC